MILTFFLGFSLIFISEYLKRRERDSNPRYLSVRRFSRPVQSTTLPSLLTCYASHGRHIAVLNIRTMPYWFCGCKVRAFCWFLQIFPQLFCSKDEKRRIKAPKGGFLRVPCWDGECGMMSWPCGLPLSKTRCSVKPHR